MNYKQLPEKQGLYDPQFEHDSCGVGFVCHIKGKKSRAIVEQGLEILRRLSHRGATGADPKTGDGAGIIMQMPHEFFVQVCAREKIALPAQGDYGTGLVFLPREKKERDFCRNAFLKIIGQEKQKFLGWRNVPTDTSGIGIAARDSAPVIEQVFIGKGNFEEKQIIFERKLYLIRKQVENIIRDAALKEKQIFYVTNLSSRTFCYKGLLMPQQLGSFFPELKEKNLKSALCLVHSRYSTNTFPTWNLSQPFRFLAHNGEINTLRGNINWMIAREGLLRSEIFGGDIEKLKPLIVPGGSDSAAIDNVFELLTLSGRSLPHAMMMLIPGAWENSAAINEKLKAFYQYHACFMEPWDGPAAIAFTDGTSVGAVLDRNGLRPARYLITKNNLVVMASEMGVLDVLPQDIVKSGRLEPGKMLYIDTGEGRIIQDEELKEKISSQKPYAEWLRKRLIRLEEIPDKKTAEKEAVLDTPFLLKAFGYSREDLRMIIKPMAETGHEPTGSMGNDIPHAVLSERPQLLYNYFKQLFAQVTNPAIDPIREEIVMSQQSFLGPEKGILEETSEHCHKLWVKNPILGNEELNKIKGISINGFKTKTVSLLFKKDKADNLLEALDKVCNLCVCAIKEGYTFIILSDKGINKDFAAIPALLATGAVHHYLVKKALRTQISIIVESAEPREVHHLALLFGFGADCVNPYLAYEAINHLISGQELNIEAGVALKNYIHALEKGILKILSKMGISTLQSYRGAQIFEALGLHQEVIDKSFCGMVSRIGGADFTVLTKEVLQRHESACVQADSANVTLESGGVYQWRHDGEFHLWNPDTIAALQEAVRRGDYQKYKEFAQLINNQAEKPTTLRGLFKFSGAGKNTSVSLDEVEPVSMIMKRFATGAMSFGSISKEAHETIAIAMNRLGGRSNTGEGGEDPARFIPLANGDSKRSAIKQVASGRFGVTANYLINADELQIKIAQGAKPGEGGQLPGHKVSAVIAKTRYTTPGVTLISPPPHHDIYSIEDLAQLIFDLKNVNPRARISVKLVSEIGVGTVAAGVAKGHADMILISGGDGGTGASPLSSIKHAGLPWELGLSETHQTLVLNELRSRVRLQTDGQMRTGRDVAIATMLGAEEYGFCSSVLVVLGCVMLRHCHLNNCSLGVATQDDILRKRFSAKPDFIINYFNFVAQELREIMAQLGVKTINELVGRTDLLEMNEEIIPWKAKGLDYSRIFYKPRLGSDVGLYCRAAQEHNIEKVLDKKLIAMVFSALKKKEKAQGVLEIKNTDRATGAMLSGELVKSFGEKALTDDAVRFNFKGVAGQSFGAWLSKGITFELEGMANDYVGKGISGGKIIIYPDAKSQYDSFENIIIGNTAFYGAISGEAYISGIAGERFCIRNSGLHAVVEGLGDHGCEYMTGGIVAVLGKTGRNFGAGMSGGIAYVYDNESGFKTKCNLNMVNLEKMEESDKTALHELLLRHHKYTQSRLAKKMLDNFGRESEKFIKVMPIEYKKILEDKKLEEQLDLTEVSDS